MVCPYWASPGTQAPCTRSIIGASNPSSPSILTQGQGLCEELALGLWWNTVLQTKTQTFLVLPQHLDSVTR